MHFHYSFRPRNHPSFVKILIYSCFLFLIAYLLSCSETGKRKEAVGFYYWKTIYKLTKFETDYLKQHQVKKIYLHCFDVMLENNIPTPQGVLMWNDTPQNNLEYIPTVFIKNEIFLNTDTNALKFLADKIVSLCTQIFTVRNLSISEIQIDCDWTKTTRDSYFYFLTFLKQKNIMVSNTLRLYQYKYRNESGIAPTDYACLMCYNMGNMKDEMSANSILNKKDLTAYLSSQSVYPNPINVALPIFNWTLLYSQHSFKGILYKNPDWQNNHWKRISDIQYLCIQNYYDLNCEQEFYKDEIIRIEHTSKQDLKDAILTIKKHVKNSKNEIIYFDLDSAKIRNCLY